MFSARVAAAVALKSGATTSGGKAMRSDVSAGTPLRTRAAITTVVAAVVAVGLLPWLGAEAARPAGGANHSAGRNDKLLFFAADGLRQDIVKRYADQRAVPGFR